LFLSQLFINAKHGCKFWWYLHTLQYLHCAYYCTYICIMMVVIFGADGVRTCTPSKVGRCFWFSQFTVNTCKLLNDVCNFTFYWLQIIRICRGTVSLLVLILCLLFFWLLYEWGIS
jgi:hypothetical protein